MARTIPLQDEVLNYFQTCSNWGRWGPDDELGTMHYVTPEKRKRAIGLVKEGVSVTCSRLIETEMAADVRHETLHLMSNSGERWAGKKSRADEPQSATEFIGFDYHGYTITHIDSPAHFFWDGKMYNGHPAEAVTTSEGATKESVDLLRDGVLSRGVLLDMPKLKGVNWLDKNEAVLPEDLDEAERAFGVRVEAGDVLLVRTGIPRRRDEEGPYNVRVLRPGVHAACLPWLHQREVAMLGSDTANDVVPSGYEMLRLPVHQVGIVAMGLWLLDNASFEQLAEACERYGRWEFMLTMAPLRIEYATGSPLNPVATF